MILSSMVASTFADTRAFTLVLYVCNSSLPTLIIHPTLKRIRDAFVIVLFFQSDYTGAWRPE